MSMKHKVIYLHNEDNQWCEDMVWDSEDCTEYINIEIIKELRDTLNNCDGDTLKIEKAKRRLSEYLENSNEQ